MRLNVREKLWLSEKPSWYAISVMLNGEPESSSLAASICWMLMYVFKCIPVIFEKYRRDGAGNIEGTRQFPELLCRDRGSSAHRS